MTEQTSPAEVLRRARNRIATPDRWLKGTYHADADPVWPEVPDDGPCDIVGALVWATGEQAALDTPAGTLLIEAASAHDPSGGPNAPARVNDHPSTDHALVLRIYDAAIAAAEREPSRAA